MHSDTPQIDFTSLMNQIKKEGFISTMRSGPTGIGFTLESILGINENNHNTHDFMDVGRFKDYLFELKANRSITWYIPGKAKKNRSMLSLVTQAPHGGLSNRKLIENYGYPATDGRDTINLYATLVCTRYTNGNNVKNMKIERENHRLYIVYKNERLSYYNLIEIFKKINNLAIVRTEAENRFCTCGNIKLHDKKTKKYHEYFNFNECHIFINLNLKKFYEHLDNGKMKLDLRLHIPKNIRERIYHDPTHDHGTGFRTIFPNIEELYEKHYVL